MMRKPIMSICLIFLLVISALFGIIGIFSTCVIAESWEIEIVDSFSQVGESTSIALDSQGNPHISYYDRTNSALKYAKLVDGDWEIETVDSEDDVGRYTSIALDAFDNPHISYYDATNRDLKYAGWIHEEWVIETLDSYGEVGGYSSIAVDTNNCVHISYYDGTMNQFTYRDSLKYAFWDGSSWSIETVDAAADIGRFTSIVIDSNNFPHISYIDYGEDTLRYTRWTGSEWDIQEISQVNHLNENLYDYGSGTSLALDSNDNPHIVFIDGINNGLKYARWDGESWLIKDVGDVRQVFFYVSLELDNQDHPHITYYSLYENTINYAKLVHDRWVIVYVEESGRSFQGKFNSLALDENDYAHISYFDSSLYDLKYAKLNPQGGTLEEVNFEVYEDPIYILPIQPPPPVYVDPIIEPITITPITIITHPDPIYEYYPIERDPSTDVTWTPAEIFVVPDPTPPSYFEYEVITTDPIYFERPQPDPYSFEIEYEFVITPSDPVFITYEIQEPEPYTIEFEDGFDLPYQVGANEESERILYNIEIPHQEMEPEIVYVYIPVDSTGNEETYEFEEIETTSDFQKNDDTENNLIWYVAFFAGLSCALFFFLVITLVVVYRSDKTYNKK